MSMLTLSLSLFPNIIFKLFAFDTVFFPHLIRFDFHIVKKFNHLIIIIF